MGVPETGVLKMTDGPSPPAVAASVPERKPLTPAAKRALAEAGAGGRGGGAGAEAASRGNPPAGGQGTSGPEGAGADPLRRLGEQGHRFGFLNPEISSPRNLEPNPGSPEFGRRIPRHAIARLRTTKIAMTKIADQRATTTVVPTETRSYKSAISEFSMRMQP